MIRTFVVIFAVLAAIASGWVGYRLSGKTLGQVREPTAAVTENGNASETLGMDKALVRLLGNPFTDLGGRPQALTQWSGKVLVVNFWATWCSPCREEMPGFSRLQKKYAQNGVQFVGIGIDDADKIQQYQKETPVTYPLLVAGLEAMSLTAALGNRTEGLPFTVFVDRKGQLHSIKVGLLEEKEVERRLRELL